MREGRTKREREKEERERTGDRYMKEESGEEIGRKEEEGEEGRTIDEDMGRGKNMEGVSSEY